ncbi:MAG: bifunctional sugar-1-phosphate nucleotidylyltransferase/acetyltransferase [Candidatus Helarchaeota archaeon]
MAAGEGKRLRPLTEIRPKPMLPIAGKPHLQIILESLHEYADISDIILIVGHQQEKIKDYFQDGSEFGLHIEYATQKKPLGTGHAAHCAKEFIDSETFLLMNGDILLSPSIFHQLIRYYKEYSNTSLISVKKVPDPSSYGIVQFHDSTGDIIEIIEKPAPHQIFKEAFTNIGLYIFTPSIFEAIEETQPSPRGEIEITDSIQILVKKGMPVKIFKVDDFWLDIGRPWDLLDANKYILNQIPLQNKGMIEDNVTLIGKIGIGKGTRIRSGSYLIGPLLIGEHCDIGPNCYIRPYCCFGENVHVGHACELKNTIIFDNSSVPHLSYIGDTIIGSEVNLGAGTITANLRFDKKTVKVNIKGKRMDSGRKKMGAIIGDYSQTGIGATIMPGVKIGPFSIVGSNVTVYEDVPPNTVYKEPKKE